MNLYEEKVWKSMISEKKKNGTRIASKGIRDDVKLFLFILPLVIYIFYACYFPIWGWGYAFVEQKLGKSLFEMEFVGLQNFKTILGTPLLRKQTIQSILNTIGIQTINFLLMPLPMFFAIFLSEVKSKKFQKLVQTAATLPHFVGWVVVYSLAVSLLSGSGIINIWLERMGMEPIKILTSSKHVWLTQSVIFYWKSLGWSAIVYFAAISGIDQQMYEAAALDGVTRLQKIWYITIPNLMPTFLVLFIMNIGNFLATGVEQYQVFSNAMNADKIQTLDLYVFNLGLGQGRITYGVCVGILTSVVALTLFTVANLLSKKIRGSSIF